MNKKFLYIDPFYQPQHSDFNNGYIAALRKTGATLHFVVVKGYEKHLNIDTNDVLYQIPAFLERSDFGGFGNRICHLLSLLLIRFKIKLSDYDIVFFSNFDEISFYFSGIKNTILVPHINISESGNKLKFFFLNKVLQKNTCIAFNKSIIDYLNTKGKYRIIEQPLGLPKAIKLQQNINYTDNDKNIIKHLSAYKKIIFSPSSYSNDNDFIQNLINDKLFLTSLEKENIIFVAKGNFTSPHANFMGINYYLSSELYQYLFINSYCILLAYPKNFRYRVSAILFECFANNKACLLPDNKVFTPYSDYFNYNAFFTDTADLIDKIKQINNTQHYYLNIEKLQPDFKQIS